MIGKCKHCGERIVLFNFALGPQWRHQPEGASFQDGTSLFCATTAAEPQEDA